VARAVFGVGPCNHIVQVRTLAAQSVPTAPHGLDFDKRKADFQTNSSVKLTWNTYELNMDCANLREVDPKTSARSYQSCSPEFCNSNFTPETFWSKVCHDFESGKGSSTFRSVAFDFYKLRLVFKLFPVWF